jgi:uncharacterized phage infection (PIP) family protein YhgE
LPNTTWTALSAQRTQTSSPRSEVTDIVAEIAAASREQSTGIEQVNRAVTQMDEATQQNAALVEEAAAASRAIVDQMQSLSTLISRYQLGTAAPPEQRPHMQPRLQWRARPRGTIADGCAMGRMVSSALRIQWELPYAPVHLQLDGR